MQPNEGTTTTPPMKPPTIINLTPHNVNVVGANGEIIATFPPSGGVARVAVTSYETSLGGVIGVPTTHSVMGEITGLPEAGLKQLSAMKVALEYSALAEAERAAAAKCQREMVFSTAALAVGACHSGQVEGWLTSIGCHWASSAEELAAGQLAKREREELAAIAAEIEKLEQAEAAARAEQAEAAAIGVDIPTLRGMTEKARRLAAHKARLAGIKANKK